MAKIMTTREVSEYLKPHEITIFNPGITLFTTDDERVRRIHRVLCKLDKE